MNKINKNIEKYYKKNKIAWENCYIPFTALWHLVHFNILNAIKKRKRR